MNLRFQYNKTSLQQLAKQLRIRERALPTLKNKESALRMEVKLSRNRTEELAARIEEILTRQDKDMRMWSEFDFSLVKVSGVKMGYRKIAGVNIPELEDIEFTVKDYNLFLSPGWFPAGIRMLKELIGLTIEREISRRKTEILEVARRKTTQKVNLYEKVQIPEYRQAIMKIKRFLEDEENLARAAQKIVKKRQYQKTEAEL